MRAIVQSQLSIVQPPIEHNHAQELQVISNILDQEPKAVELVYADIVRHGGDTQAGRKGMTAEQVLRALIVKQMNDFSYEQLAFHLADSCTYRSFCRMGISNKPPAKSALQDNIKQVTPQTLEAINCLLIQYARSKGIESGRQVRFDCTVVESNIHKPRDSELLWDGVRVLTRLMQKANEELGPLSVLNHTRRAKRRALAILHAKDEKTRRKLYKDLLKVTWKTINGAEKVVKFLDDICGANVVAVAIAREMSSELRAVIELVYQVISQTERRVFGGEQVTAEEKIVSIFEPHTDIIIKDRREILFGHKLCLSSGVSGMVTDCVIEEGNPADSTLAVEMVKRQKSIFDKVPSQVAFDGGFASKENLQDIKGLGVKDVAFSKRRGLPLNEMVKSSWVYRKLRNFRAGIEGIISFLKRAFGLDRCTWKGHSSFKSYVWASIVSANVLLIARHEMT